MKKYLEKLLCLALVLVLALSVFGTVQVSAAEEEDDDYINWTFHYATNDKTKEFKGEEGNTVIANCFYQRLVFTGFSKGIKKINKTLKKLSKSFDCSGLYSYAEEDAKLGRDRVIYDDYTMQEIHSVGEHYVSVVVSRYWWAGGVSNSFCDGYTFDTKTGKLIKPSKITGLSFKELKNKFKKAIESDPDYIADSGYFDLDAFLDGLEESDVNYYINGDEFVIIIPPYTLGGGWYRTYVLDGVSVNY